jgi:hypothetical protein
MRGVQTAELRLFSAVSFPAAIRRPPTPDCYGIYEGNWNSKGSETRLPGSYVPQGTDTRTMLRIRVDVIQSIRPLTSWEHVWQTPQLRSFIMHTIRPASGLDSLRWPEDFPLRLFRICSIHKH